MEWSGYLSLRVSGGLVTVWKRRWFELTMNALTSFEDQGRPMKGKVSFRGASLATPLTPCFTPFTHPPSTHPTTYYTTPSWA